MTPMTPKKDLLTRWGEALRKIEAVATSNGLTETAEQAGDAASKVEAFRANVPPFTRKEPPQGSKP